MNFVIVDSRGTFNSDIGNRLAICDDVAINVCGYLTSLDGLSAILGANAVNAVIIADNVMEQPNFTIPTIATYVYQTKPESTNLIMQYGLPYLGMVRTAKELIDILLNLQAQPIATPQNMQQPNASTVPQPTQMPYTTPQTAVQQTAMPYGNQMQNVSSMGQNMSQPSGLPEMPTAQPMPTYPQQAPVQPVPQPMQVPVQPMQTPVQPTQTPVQPVQYQQPMPQQPLVSNTNSQMNGFQNPAQVPMSDGFCNPSGAAMGYSVTMEDPLAPIEIKEKAKVVTIYSAKGGVGKTTISSEIAAYLSLTCKKRSKLRVCIVDYNIDFGDVMTTLGFAADGVNMCLWASEINERIKNGESVEYSASEIEKNFLQKKSFTEDAELYGLLAPPNHEDSMVLTEEALDIMLKNLTYNGDFDFVICDTGNNTRDSSIIALDYADFIFLVVTQDITTINCNDSFITTMRKMEFDESRVSMIINNITSSKDTSISVHDIESFENFPCIARIKRNPDVIKANNQSIPLVFKSNHEFTKELRNIITFLINDGEVVKEEKKKFSFFNFGKKGNK